MLDPRTEGGAIRITGMLAAFLWLFLSWPLVTGQRAVYLRDNFNLFLPLKAYGAAELAAGRIPAVNSTWGLGQPFRGNPNAAAFYPGNLLYLVVPFWSAWGAHFALHWLLAALTMAALARELGASRAAILLAALTYAGSGWMLSNLTFYTSTVVAAWWPLVIWGVVRGGRRGLGVGALACGLALLGGEVVLAALGFLPVLVFALWRCGPRQGVLRTIAVAAAGAVVALPQIVAFARVLPYSFRASHGLPAGQVGAYALAPERLFELLVPFPFASPLSLPLPYLLSIFFGLAALVMAFNARPGRADNGHRANPFWPACGLTVAGLGLAWIGGPAAPWLKTLTFGLFRYPEKAIAWVALGLPLLAAIGFDRARQGAVGWKPWWTLAGVLTALLVVVSSLGFGGATPEARAHLATQIVLALLVLALMAFAVRRQRATWIVALQLVSLLQLHPLWLTDDTSIYRQTRGLGERLEGAEAVLPVRLLYPPWETAEGAAAATEPFAATRRNAVSLGQGPGVLQGLTYPAAPDVEGLHHVFFHFGLFWASQGSWEQRLAWSRQLGVEAIASDRALPPNLGLEPQAALEADGRVTRLYRLESAPELAWWPRTLEPAESPRHAFDRVTARARPSDGVAVPLSVEHTADGRIRAIEHSPDHLELDVSSSGGIAVVRRAFQPFWKARIGDQTLPVFPVDLAFLGILVPAGEHRVDLAIDGRPELWGTVAALVATGLLGLAIFTDRRRRADAYLRS